MSKMQCKRPQLLLASYRALLQDSKPQSLVRKYGTVSAAPAQAVTTPPSSTFENALAASGPRNNWTRGEIKEIYDTPLMKLAFASVSVSLDIKFINSTDID
jgi:biotin synthase